MEPIIRKTALLNEWNIITRYTKKKDHILAHIKYPIPEKDIEHIANDYLIEQLKKVKKGYTYTTGSKDDGTLCRVTVERIKEESNKVKITDAEIEQDMGIGFMD